MTNSKFPRHLIEEIEETQKAIDIAADQIVMLAGRARDLCDLATRYVREGKLHDGRSEEIVAVGRHAGEVIDRERDAQREVERREQGIDDGKINAIVRGSFDRTDPAHVKACVMAPKIEVSPIPTDERAAIIQDIAELSGQVDADDNDAARDIVRNIAEPDESDGADWRLAFDVVAAGTSVGKTLEEAAVEFVRGTIAAQTQVEESLPGQAEEVSTGAAEAASPSPAEAAPVDVSVSDAVENAPEAAAEVSQVAPHPGDASAVDEKPPLGDRFYRESPQEIARRQEQERADRQNANAKEAAEFSDKVLYLWSTELLTEAQIAKRLVTGSPLISQIIEQARTDQDPRVMGKRGVVPKPPKEHMPLSAIARKIMDRPAPVAAARAGVELGDFKPPEATAENLVSSGVCVVDLSRNKIFGKKGTWTTDSSRARTIANLNNGQMYPVSVIQQRCGWRDERELRDAITPMMERLRDIGIIMTSLPTGIVIRVDD